MHTSSNIVKALRLANLEFSKSAGYKVERSNLVGGWLVMYCNSSQFREKAPSIIEHYIDKAAAALDAAGIGYKRHAETLEIPFPS